MSNEDKQYPQKIRLKLCIDEDISMEHVIKSLAHFLKYSINIKSSNKFFFFH